MEYDKDELRQIKKMLTEIHHVVIGGEHEKETGLLSRVQELEEQVNDNKSFFNKVKWFCFGLAAPASWGVLDILKAIFVKH